LYCFIAFSLTVQSIRRCASSGKSVPATMAAASMSQPDPSEGITTASGAPSLIDLAPRKAKDTPIGTSPRAASLQGFEPEWV